MDQSNPNLPSRGIIRWRPREELFFTAVIEDLFDDFLRYSFCNADEIFDLKRGFDFLDDELGLLFPETGPPLEADGCGDKLVRAFDPEGNELYFIVHYFTSDSYQSELPKKIFDYFSNVWAFYGKMPTSILWVGGRYNPMYPCGFGQGRLGSSISFSFNSFHVMAEPLDKLEESHNSFAKALLIVQRALKSSEHLSDTELFEQKLELTRHLFSKRIPDRKLATLITFMRYYQQFRDREMNWELEKAIIDMLRKD